MEEQKKSQPKIEEPNNLEDLVRMWKENPDSLGYIYLRYIRFYNKHADEHRTTFVQRELEEYRRKLEAWNPNEKFMFIEYLTSVARKIADSQQIEEAIKILDYRSQFYNEFVYGIFQHN